MQTHITSTIHRAPELRRRPDERQIRRRRHGRRPGGRALFAAVAMIAALLTIGSSPASAEGGGVVVVNEGSSIQAAIDAAAPGTKIVVTGNHVENLWIQTDGISLVGRDATLTLPEEAAPNPCLGPNPEDPAPPTLICVFPPVEGLEGPPTAEQRLNGVSIMGFSLHSPAYDAVGVLFTNNVRVEGNTITSPGCDGIFVIFADGVIVNRNAVSGAGCGGVNVSAASDVRIRNNQMNGSFFNGIAVNDATRVVVHGNTASDNCIGIGVVDGADEGYGVRAEEFPGDIVRISSNVTNGNNKTCPFGPPEAGLLIGGTGIVAGGMHNLTVKNNTANDNVAAEASLTASGIMVTDFPNPDGSFNVTDLVRITGNTATGNSSPAGPVDLTVDPTGTKINVAANTCGVSVPDPTWCGG